MLESGAKLDVAVLSVKNRELKGGEGGFEWTVRVQRRGQIPVPLEVIAHDNTGEEHRWTWLATPGETTRTFRVVRPRALKSARLGPDWIGILDGDITNNARLVDEHKDIRPAVVLTARWTLYVDELLRTYVGVDR